MAYLNEAERTQLLNDLTQLNFMQAKRKLRRMDKDGKMVMFRNVQQTGEWYTRYDLRGLGTRVTLIEDRVSGYDGDPSTRIEQDYALSQVIVEPLPDNRT